MVLAKYQLTKENSIAMKSITHSARYLPHTIDTRYYSVKLYRGGCSVNFVCRKYHISKASLMRWNKRFDGTRDSLRDKSHRPLSPHPNAHTETELKWINDLHRRNPHISICEMYGKLRSQKGYSRQRFIYPYREQSSYSTIDFVKRAIRYFGYRPQIIQTDNGFEFTYPKDYKRIHPFDLFCEDIGIKHKLIRPRTPWHNGKVERSHRNDQERFYNFLSFYSFNDLKEQMYRYMRRSNRIPMAVLGWISPIEKRSQLEK